MQSHKEEKTSLPVNPNRENQLKPILQGRHEMSYLPMTPILRTDAPRSEPCLH